MNKKILITYTSYGNGHKAAAEYIYNYFKDHNKNLNLKIIDTMEYGNLLAKIDKKSFEMNYKFRPNHLFFSIIYNLSDNNIITSPYKLIVKLILKKKLKKEILDYKPDIVISTHFFGSILIGILKDKYNLKTKTVTIITDYKAHHLWIKNQANEDAIIVSNEIVKKELIKYHVPKEKIYPFGIPLSSKFKNLDDIHIIKEKYHVNNNKLTILFLGGGSYGSNFSYTYFKSLVKEQLDINIIFVAGNNKKLERKCLKYVQKENLKNINIMGYTNDISNLLNISTLVITKPGGLSITEAIEMKKPMILIPGNGGPESYNAKFILKNGFGYKISSKNSLRKVVKKLYENPKLIENMSNNLNNLEKNKSIEKLYNLVMEMDVE